MKNFETVINGEKISLHEIQIEFVLAHFMQYKYFLELKQYYKTKKSNEPDIPEEDLLDMAGDVFAMVNDYKIAKLAAFDKIIDNYWEEELPAAMKFEGKIEDMIPNYKLEINGKVIELDESVQCKIVDFYRQQSMKEFLQDNYSNKLPDATDEDYEKIASDARRLIEKYDYQESDAILESISNFNKEHKNERD